MTARADRLTHGARTPDNAGVVRSSYPASSLRVFVRALEGLDYRMAPLLAEAGIHRADLDKRKLRGVHAFHAVLDGTVPRAQSLDEHRGAFQREHTSAFRPVRIGRQGDAMPKSGAVGSAWRRQGRSLPAELPNAVADQIVEICSDLAVQAKRMRQLKEQADELRKTIHQWGQSESDSYREPVSRGGRR
jgi:hypothetical protein